MLKTLRVIQILIFLTYPIFYFFPEWFHFNSQGLAHYQMAFLFGILIANGKFTALKTFNIENTISNYEQYFSDLIKEN